MITNTIPILFEDDSLLAVNKPAGLLVHGLPERMVNGEWRIKESKKIPTLVDWFIKQYPQAADLSWPDITRPGIVHRLDRDTSGVMLLAKSPEVLATLQQEFAQRTVRKTYLALVAGSPSWNEKTVIAAVSRGEGTKRRASFFVAPNISAKPAETRFHVLQRLELAESGIWNIESGRKTQNSRFKSQDSAVSLLEAKPLTGRTHQIRVHLGLEDLPILGDPWYQTKISKKLADFLKVPRLMLHAKKLAFIHPTARHEIILEAPLAIDFNLIIASLKPKG